MWSFLFFESHFKIQHQQGKRHDDRIRKHHWKIFPHNSVHKPDGNIGDQNQNHPYGQISNRSRFPSLVYLWNKGQRP